MHGICPSTIAPIIIPQFSLLRWSSITSTITSLRAETTVSAQDCGIAFSERWFDDAKGYPCRGANVNPPLRFRGDDDMCLARTTGVYHANFGCGALPVRRARSVLGQSSSRPSKPDAIMMTALMVKPVMY